MSNKVVIYTVNYCPFCKKAKELLNFKGIAFDEIDSTANENETRQKLAEMTDGRDTFPQVFINGKSIGGYTELKELNEAGTLEPLVVGSI